MSNAITWDHEALLKEAEGNFTALRRITRLIVIAVVLILSAAALNFVSRFLPEGQVATWTDRVTLWILFLAIGGTYFGGKLLLKKLAQFRDWENECQKEWSERLKSGEKILATASGGFRTQLMDSNAAQERLLKQNAELAARNTALQDELDKKKVSEKTLHEQRRELTRSKDVLEVHVQERTQEIQKLQRRYELILNSAGDGICGLDMNGKATFVNPAAARLTGWEVKELVGRPEHEIFGSTTVTKDAAPNGTKLKDQSFRRRDGSSTRG